MKLVTSQQMKAIDQRAIVEWQIPEIVLMENAGRAVVDRLEKKFANLANMTVTIVAGSGNNGGDGLVTARHLYNLGTTVKVFLLAERPFSESTQSNLTILQKLPVRIYSIENANSIHLFKATLNYTDIVIDAILGTGINRAVSPLIEEVMAIINKRSCYKVAIDLPSGLNADNGMVWGSAIKADLTVALAAIKRGELLNEGQALCGELICVDIGIPKDIFDAEAITTFALDNTYLAGVLKPRVRQSHKGTYGHLLTIGGSKGMSGSIALTNKGALRSGVGVLTSAVPESIYLPVAVMQPEVMVHGLNDQGSGHFHRKGLTQLQELLVGQDALVIGPGFSKMDEDELTAFLEEVITAVECPLVIDADGLNLLVNRLELLTAAKGPLILTPHPGEMARLTGMTTVDVQTNRLAVAENFAKTYGVFVVLKGANTIIAAPDGTIWLNLVDSPALATAGSGDVLSGIIGAFLAQGYAPAEACTAAVNLHGQAGVLVAQKKGEISSQSGDLIEEIANVIREVMS